MDLIGSLNFNQQPAESPTSHLVFTHEYIGLTLPGLQPWGSPQRQDAWHSYGLGRPTQLSPLDGWATENAAWRMTRRIRRRIVKFHGDSNKRWVLFENMRKVLKGWWNSKELYSQSPCYILYTTTKKGATGPSSKLYQLLYAWLLIFQAYTYIGWSVGTDT